MSAEVIDEFRGRYHFLSNFSTEGGALPTAEHHYQASKADTVKAAIYVMSAPTPGEAKQRGRHLKIRDDWEDVKLDVMYDILVVKFSVEPIRTKLLDTGDAILIEGNTWGDQYWGKCRGKGLNNLGLLLMLIRTDCRAASQG